MHNLPFKLVLIAGDRFGSMCCVVVNERILLNVWDIIISSMLFTLKILSWPSRWGNYFTIILQLGTFQVISLVLRDNHMALSYQKNINFRGHLCLSWIEIYGTFEEITGKISLFEGQGKPWYLEIAESKRSYLLNLVRYFVYIFRLFVCFQMTEDCACLKNCTFLTFECTESPFFSLIFSLWIESCHKKNFLGVFYQVCHKQGSAATEHGLRLEF